MSKGQVVRALDRWLPRRVILGVERLEDRVQPNASPVVPVGPVSNQPAVLASTVYLVSEDDNVLLVNSLTGAVIATYSTGVANDGSAIGPDGSIYVGDYGNDQILHLSPTGALLGEFSTSDTPQGLDFGPDGNLYVSTTNNKVLKYSPTGTFLGTFISASSGGLSNAKGIVWGPNGNAYVSSYSNSKILEYNGTTGAFIKDFASGGDGLEQIAFGPDGNLYAADYGDGSVLEFNGTTGSLIGTVVSGVTNAYGIAFDPAGNLDVSSRLSSGTIQEFSPTGTFLRDLVAGLTNPSFLHSTSTLVTSESGVESQVSYELSQVPTSPVTLNLIASAPGELSASTLTFTPSNWDVPQTVIVSGANEYISGGAQSFEITGTASSVDLSYLLALSSINGLDEDASVATTTTLVSSDAASTYGGSVTFTATVAASSGIPTGSVSFYDGTTLLGNVALNSGAAALTITSLGAGDHSITSYYDASSVFASSQSSPLAQSVAPAVLTVTAKDETKTYGQANPTLGYAISGFVNSDTAVAVQGAPTISATAGPGSPVGNYTITAALGTLRAANYTFQFQNGTLNVTPATLTVTADDENEAYGQPLPTLGYAITGFVNGNNSSVVSGAPILSTTAAQGSPVGAYGITVALGSLSAPNYDFQLVNGDLTITKAVLTVTATDASTVYGQPIPALQYTITGYANEDPTTVVTGAPSESTIAYDGSGAGNYGIVLGIGSLSASNYSFRLVNGDLTIDPAVLTVTAQDETKIYGQANPAFADDLTGFVNGDTASVVHGGASFTTTAAASGNVGEYAIIPGLGTLNAANYTFVFSDGTLGITPATLTVSANNGFMMVGQAVPPLGDMITGFVNGDTAAVIQGSAALSTTATHASPVGEYPITSSEGTLNATNYVFTFVDGTMTVSAEPPVLTVTATDVSRASGQANPNLSYTITGFVNGDGSSVVSGAPSLTAGASSSSGPGVYSILVGLGSLQAAGYTFAFVSGTLTITPAVNTGPSASTHTDFSATSLSTSAAASIAAADPAAASDSASAGDSSTIPLYAIPSSSAEAAGATSGGHGRVYMAASGSSAPSESWLSVAWSPDHGAQSSGGFVKSAGIASRTVLAPLRGEVSAIGIHPAAPQPETRRVRDGSTAPRTIAASDNVEPDSSIFTQLDEAVEEMQATANEYAFADTVVVASGVAVAGSVLLNTRAVYWFLSALLARPAMWRRFDPLDVIYAWERERIAVGHATEDGEESLQSLVS